MKMVLNIKTLVATGLLAIAMLSGILVVVHISAFINSKEPIEMSGPVLVTESPEVVQSEKTSVPELRERYKETEDTAVPAESAEAGVSTESAVSEQLRRIQIRGYAQGTTYSIIYYAADTIVSKKSIDSLLNRIDQSLSIYKTGSLINRFNNSSTGSQTDHHLTTVVIKSLEIYKETKGLFDITIMPLTEAWGFGSKRDTMIPTDQKIRSILPCIGSQHLKPGKLLLKKDKPCVRIDINGIAQGYSVDLLAGRLEKSGIRNYIVELGGEIRVKGRKPGNEKMKIGIESPATEDLAAGILKRILVIDSGAITTSGNYRKFYESQGKHISHLFDPRTGYPISNELIAATVYAPDAITADGYDNALMNMGLAGAFKFLEKNNAQLEAYFIYRDKAGRILDTATAGFYRLIQPSTHSVE